MPSKANKRRENPHLPKNWPAGLPYLTHPRLTAQLTASAAARDALNLRLPQQQQQQQQTPGGAPSALVRIRHITDASHPACGQHGLFAARSLPARSWVLDYLGLYHLDGESDGASDYDLSLDREAGVSVDAARCGNEARFINDYRGTGSRRGGNCEFGVRAVGDARERRMAVFVGAVAVRKGEELVVSYGKGFWRGRREGEVVDGDVAGQSDL
jgi:hypothetical protein